MILLDLFCGRWGWSRAFANRGWHCIGVDLTDPPEIPGGCQFLRTDVLYLSEQSIPAKVDAIVASSPCEEFSVHSMKHFHPNPKYPEMGIKLFNHTRQLCEAAGVPYVMENVRAAQQFVGNATCHAGSFYLWHNLGNFPLRFGHPFKMPSGISKGATQMRRDGRFARAGGVDERMYKAKGIRASELATIPPELANCVADYFESVLEKQEVTA